MFTVLVLGVVVIAWIIWRAPVAPVAGEPPRTSCVER